jgi:hypothetical protein
MDQYQELEGLKVPVVPEQGIAGLPTATDNEHAPYVPPPPEDAVAPQNPSSMPRAEDDAETFARSSDFHDVPDPGPNVGRPEPESPH